MQHTDSDTPDMKVQFFSVLSPVFLVPTSLSRIGWVVLLDILQCTK